ncbi:M20/M25/M40 family metallo-hydrolase [Salipiger abyssi]|uniref:Acetylornithine deacetylase/succinyldiaminopimelate desuccinylase-like deacylase n=1 Tax=Salipiger abyssi TaxID=1250539 RepID=A0A1P8V1A0_9RHOB|nr:M20/M25/M40 family metallo-hydrolase [Salipiger abyssi]APZ55398.1 acetylornithine deacetylase/succinyldiaminopimelate desuccinylase-like deacylase [Salipiger abyssi]
MSASPGDLPEGFLDDLCALLSIPSVAAWQARGDGAMQSAAEWLRARLARAGLSARLIDGPRGAPPYVYAEGAQHPERPTLLIYGHYDVQPASRADGWSSDPFMPELRDGRLYARGATDQKMNLLLPVAALESLGTGEIGWNVKLFLEGEEEIFSPHIAETLARHRALLACDLCLSSDGWQAGPQQGDLRLGLRGFCGLEVTLQGAARDLHSGTFGGVAPNPAAALTQMIAGLWDAAGEVALPGFLDGVTPPGAEEIATARAGFDAGAWRRTAGLDPDAPLPVADEDIPVQAGLMPALEVNALDAGDFAGGFRSIVPREASARLSCRLVPGQEPDRICGLVSDALERATPPGLRLSVTPLPGSARAYRIAADHPGQHLAARALEAVDGQTPRLSYSGGSIPILGEIDRQLGVKTVIFGFGLPDENMHGADEFCRLSDITRGLAAWRMFLRRGARDR